MAILIQASTRFLFICLLALLAATRSGAQAKSASPSPSESSSSAASLASSSSVAIDLLQNSDNALQLGLVVSGEFSYPFTFTANPGLSNGITLSPGGLISGKPSAGTDQKTMVTVTDSTGKMIATYELDIHFVAAISVALSAPAKPAPDPANADTKTMTILLNSSYVGGDTITGSVLKSSVGASNTPDPQNPAPDPSGTDPTASQNSQKSNTTSVGAPNVPVLIKRGNRTFASTTDASGNFGYQFSDALEAEDFITVSAPGATSAQAQVPIQTPHDLEGEDLRAIVGYQQAGASSSDFQQNWFTDFFISRPLFSGGTFRWWGNVRVASFPQAGNQSVAELASGLAAQVGALKLNQLAQGAEFLTGAEYQIWEGSAMRGLSENTLQRFSLGFIAAFGETGFFSSPSGDVPVFQVPSSSSPQWGAFQQAYGAITTPYIGFINPDSPRFAKEYLAGLRLTTRYIDPTGLPLATAPAMLGVTVGQNQVISGGKLQGVVGRIEAFYPLPFGNRGHGVAGAFSSIYLFGSAQMRFGGAKTLPALALAPAPSGVLASDPDVTLAVSPSVRDTYRLGFGVDLVSLISQLTGGSAKSATTGATSPKTSSTPSTTP